MSSFNPSVGLLEARKLAGLEGFIDDGLKGPSLRQGIITARDATARTVTVQLGGDTTASIAGVVVPGHIYPRVNDVVWLLLHGTAPLLVYNQTGRVGAVRVQKTTAMSVPNNTITFCTFSAAGVKYDTDSLYSDATNTRITFPWPGIWAFGGNVLWASSATARRILDIGRNGATADSLASSRFNATSTGDHGQIVASSHKFNAGDYIGLSLFQSSGAALDAVSSQDQSPVIWATWQGQGP